MAHEEWNIQIPSDLVVKSQTADIIDLILQLIRHQNGIHRLCRSRTPRGAVLSTSEVQWVPLNSMECGKVQMTYFLVYRHSYLSITTYSRHIPISEKQPLC